MISIFFGYPISDRLFISLGLHFHFGSSWEVLGRPGELFGEFGGTGGGSWEDLGSSLDPLWGGLGGLGGHSGVFWDDFWGI